MQKGLINKEVKEMFFGNLVKLFDPEQDIEIICNDEVVSQGKAKNFYKNGGLS